MDNRPVDVGEPTPACAACRQAHALCDKKQPCWRCVQLGKSDLCQPAPSRKRGRPPKTARLNNGTNEAPTKTSAPRPLKTWPPPPLHSTPLASIPNISSRDGIPLPSSSLGSWVPPVSQIPPPDPLMNGAGQQRRPTSRHGSDNNDKRAGEVPMAQTLLRVLVDDLREIKQENARLRHKVSKLRTHRKASEQRTQESEQRMKDMQRAMDAMTAAQKESAQQIASLMALFQPSQPSSTSSSTFSSSSSSSSTLMVTSSLPWSLADPRGPSSFSSGVSEDLLQALPFLADFDCSSLIVSHLQEPFVVMRKNQISSIDTSPLTQCSPTVAYVSPAACRFLGYDPDEVVGKPIHFLGGMDLEGKLAILQLMFTVPPSRVGGTALIKSVYLPKARPSVLLETLHQSLWVNSHPKWHFVRFMRILDEGVPVPKNWSFAEILRNPRAQAAVDARLAMLPPSVLHPMWKMRKAFLLMPSSSSSSPTSQCCSPPTSSSSPEEDLSATSASERDHCEGEERRESVPVSPVAQTMDGIDLEEVLRMLRSPVPLTPPPYGHTSEFVWNSPSPSPPSSLLDESWLVQLQHVSKEGTNRYA